MKDTEEAVSEGTSLQLSDAMLLEGVQRGSHEAFDTLFLRHYASVYSILRHLLSTPEEAEDVAQEVFLKLYRQPLSGVREHNLRAWLYRVATNLGYNTLRSAQRRQERHQRAAREPQEIGADPATLALVSEERAGVRLVLARLSRQQQACLILRYQGLSYAETAEVLQVSPKSVGTLLARAEAEFKRQYLALEKGEGKP